MRSKILENIEQHPEGTWTEEIARELKLSRATVRQYVMQLESDGKVKLKKMGQMKMIFPVDNGSK